MMSYVSRDPFARTELHRIPVHTLQTCDFCGQARKIKSTNLLYTYQIEHDGGRKESIRGLFCSIGCMRSYHG